MKEDKRGWRKTKGVESTWKSTKENEDEIGWKLDERGWNGQKRMQDAERRIYRIKEGETG